MRKAEKYTASLQKPYYIKSNLRFTTICKPKAPLCHQCVQKNECEAFRNNWVDQLPVKRKSLKKKTRWFYYFLAIYKDQYYIRKRTSKDIWQNLYEFPLLENDGPLELDAVSLCNHAREVTGADKLIISKVSDEQKQQLTHQTIIGQFISVSLHELPSNFKDYTLVPKDELKNYPFPAFINSFLKM
jgi:A/G-specific adenine glycosylase